MGLLANIFYSIVSKKNHRQSNKRSDYIFYKIVDFNPTEETYTLQCFNSRPTFTASITEIIYDIDILHGLHPIQACYIGIEYAKHLKTSNSTTTPQHEQKQKFNKYSACRYGKYVLCYQNRKGEVCFIDQNTNAEFIMDPRDIALSEELIQEFDATQAYYIGLLAGLKMNNPTPKFHEAITRSKHPHLRIVK